MVPGHSGARAHDDASRVGGVPIWKVDFSLFGISTAARTSSGSGIFLVCFWRVVGVVYPARAWVVSSRAYRIPKTPTCIAHPLATFSRMGMVRDRTVVR